MPVHNYAAVSYTHLDVYKRQQLNLSWGVRPILLGEEWEVFVLFERAINACKRDGLLEKGDVTVITSGVPIGRSGTTNMLKVQVVDD